jgi:excinuclease ABC subunit A
VQRINLTTALGTSLVNTLFVLDEPSIGLHPRDMGRVIGVMHRLRDAGNSLVVVEHDPQIMLEADRLLDMGPGPGERGGEIVFDGTPEACARRRDADRRVSLRPRAHGRSALSHEGERPAARRAARGEATPQADPRRARAQPEEPRRRPAAAAPGLRDRRLRLGQSTLMQDVLYPALRKHFGKPTEAPGSFAPARRRLARRRGDGRPDADRQDHALQPGQLRRRLRPDPQAVREGRAAGQGARLHAGTFSFNAGDGRCPTCGGNGFEHVEMQFLSDVYLRCPDCDGRASAPRCWT